MLCSPWHLGWAERAYRECWCKQVHSDRKFDVGEGCMCAVELKKKKKEIDIYHTQVGLQVTVYRIITI
jgi:hypothetical protein